MKKFIVFLGLILSVAGYAVAQSTMTTTDSDLQYIDHTVGEGT